MEMLLQTSKSAVVINGCPGPWIACKRGLRQGDDLSPYLFLLVADVLQKIIKEDGGVRHPLIDASCPVLQYADDTLILLRAESADVIRLRQLLDSFSDATGLKINYSKSTAVPMHVPEPSLRRLIRTLQCQKATFPQVYLGLPLSNVKLNLAAFSPLIAKVDRYLSGWKATLLSHAGRLVLLNTVLDGPPAHLMGAVLLPAGTVDALERRRRAFLWAGNQHATGAQCLVAWERVCLPKTDGGLGIRQLKTQNSCLLMKLLHRLHHPAGSSWARWARSQIELATLSGNVHGAHWDGLRSLLPAYRIITRSSIRNGRSTAFWEDVWLGNSTLATQFPILYSHVAHGDTTVHEVLVHGLSLVPRLTPAARSEQSALLQLLDMQTLTGEEDVRTCVFSRADYCISTSSLYRVAVSTGAKVSSYQFVWKNRAPPKVKFFAWLLLQNRIQCRTLLKKKNIIESDTCEICGREPEDAEHIISKCSFAHRFWGHLGWHSSEIPAPPLLWQIKPQAGAPSAELHTFFLLCCWQLWKHRHDVVFRAQAPNLQNLLAACRTEAQLWKDRLPAQTKYVSTYWCSKFIM
ncbi:unnamed protein product [Urochloa humidicola]